MSYKTVAQDFAQGETRAGIKVVALGPVDSLEARRVHGHCHLQRAPPGKVDKASPKTKANHKTLL